MAYGHDTFPQGKAWRGRVWEAAPPCVILSASEGSVSPVSQPWETPSVAFGDSSLREGAKDGERMLRPSASA